MFISIILLIKPINVKCLNYVKIFLAVIGVFVKTENLAKIALVPAGIRGTNENMYTKKGNGKMFDAYSKIIECNYIVAISNKLSL